MKASILRDRVTLERPVIVRSEFGEQLKTWQSFKTIWANVRFKSGIETQRGIVDFGERTILVLIRQDPELAKILNNSWRLIWRDQVLAITAVLPDAVYRDYLNLICNEGKNNGE